MEPTSPAISAPASFVAPVVESLSSTLSKQAQGKYGQLSHLEDEIKAWLRKCVPRMDRLEAEDKEAPLAVILKDGTVLSELLNHLVPGIIAKIHPPPVAPFKMIENVHTYLTTCTLLGLSESQLFDTVDLVEGKDMSKVLQHLHYISKHGKQLKQVGQNFGVQGKSGHGGWRTAQPNVGLQPLSTSSFPGRTRTARFSLPLQKSATISQAVDKFHESPVDMSPRRGRKKKHKQRRASVSSLTSDLAVKEQMKYNAELERMACVWIEKLLGERLPPGNFHQRFKSGILLCRVMNVISPKIVPRINYGSIPFRQIENISNYIKACGTIGLSPSDIFDSTDLFEGKNINLVINNLHVLARHVCSRSDWKGPKMEKEEYRKTRSLYSASLISTSDNKELVEWVNSHLSERGGELQIENLPQIFWLWFIARKRTLEEWTQEDIDEEEETKDVQFINDEKKPELELELSETNHHQVKESVPQQELKDKKHSAVEIPEEDEPQIIISEETDLDALLKDLNAKEVNLDLLEKSESGDAVPAVEEKRESKETEDIHPIVQTDGKPSDSEGERKGESSADESFKESVDEMNIPDEVLSLFGKKKKSKRFSGFNLKGLDKAWEEFQDLQLPENTDGLTAALYAASKGLPQQQERPSLPWLEMLSAASDDRKQIEQELKDGKVKKEWTAGQHPLIQDFSVSENLNKRGLRRARKTPQMEDAHAEHFPFFDSESAAFFCVLDGHGGKECADKGKVLLPQEFKKQLACTKDTGEAFKEAFLSTDQMLLDQEYLGSTASCVYIWEEGGCRYLQAANVGDSTAFMQRKDEVLRLTIDHKPNTPSERDRITQSGIKMSSTQSRVGGLAVSRALGDHFLKQENVGVISEPHVSPVIPLDLNDSIVIIASDGLWDIMNGQRAMEIANHFTTAAEIAKQLVQAALAHPKCNDNVAVIVVLL